MIGFKFDLINNGYTKTLLISVLRPFDVRQNDRSLLSIFIYKNEMIVLDT